MTTEQRYAELHAHSAFTFLDGTDEPAQMVAEAARLGLDALAILDVDGMYSTVQTTMAARDVGLPIVYGAELTLTPDALRGIIPGTQAPGWGLAALTIRGYVCPYWRRAPPGTPTWWGA